MSPRRLLHQARRAPLATLGYLILTVAIAVALVRVEQLASDNKRALCALRAEDQRDLARSRQFLEEHPGPGPFFGFTRAELEAGIREAQEDIKLTAFLGCSRRPDVNGRPAAYP